MKNHYIKERIFGLPAPKRVGHNTSATSKRIGKEYVFKVTIKGYTYYKVHVGRGGKTKTKYFKRLKQAKMFVAFLRENRYL